MLIVNEFLRQFRFFAVLGGIEFVGWQAQMSPEKLFHDLLGLGIKWEVTESRFDRECGTVVLTIRELPALWDQVRCPKDGSLVSCYDHTEELVWRHLNVFQHRCEIHCCLPRAKCRDCGHIFRVRPPWEGLSSHFTKEFEAFALLLMREMPLARVAEIVDETDTRLWRMLFRHVDQAYAEADFSNVCCVGVDEMQIRKGHSYVSVFADVVKRRVLFATEGFDHTVWEKFVEELEKHNGHRHALTEVSMDMSAAYIKGVKENCRNAQVVFDKFHVIARSSDAVERVRRDELRACTRETWEQLQGSQWLWRRNYDDLRQEQKERLDRIRDKNFATAKAYQMRVVLQDIYKSATRTVAEHRFKVWCRWVRWVARKQPRNLLRSMVKVANLVEKNLKGILGHWKSGLTNAFMEGLVSVFSATKRKARGYRSPVYLVTMLYFVAGKLRIPQS